MPEQIFLASPRGFCAGVERAIETVEKALEAYKALVYVKHQIVHNSHVVNSLAEKGAVFVESLEEVPEGSTVVFGAHSSPPKAYEEAAATQIIETVEEAQAVNVPDVQLLLVVGSRESSNANRLVEVAKAAGRAL